MALKTACLSRTSNIKVWMLVLRVSFRLFSRSSLLPQRIKLYPFFAKSIAVDFPIPEVAPVINAVFIYEYIYK